MCSYKSVILWLIVAFRNFLKHTLVRLSNWYTKCMIYHRGQGFQSRLNRQLTNLGYFLTDEG